MDTRRVLNGVTVHERAVGPKERFKRLPKERKYTMRERRRYDGLYRHFLNKKKWSLVIPTWLSSLCPFSQMERIYNAPHFQNSRFLFFYVCNFD